MKTQQDLNKKTLDTELNIAKYRIQNFLINPNKLSNDEMKVILANYRLAIEPNFIPWLQRAYETSNSNLVKDFLLKNITDEISQNHPKMLRDFTDKAGVNLNLLYYKNISKHVLNIWSQISKNNSLIDLTIVTTLENTSLIFIPYLSNIGEKLNSKDLTYTKVHGKSDLKHAQDLKLGLLNEINYYSNSKESIRTVINTIKTTTDFLENILTE